MWLGPELERVMGLTGGKVTPVETLVRPYMCVICCKPCAMPNLSLCEKRGMRTEWMVQAQGHVEIGGVLLCASCRPSHPKLRIDSYRVSGNCGEQCTCLWDGVSLEECRVCVGKDRTLMSSRSVWEALRSVSPIGLFQEEIVTRFSRHPYLGMREGEKRAFLDARIPFFSTDGKDVERLIIREREKLAKDIKRKDREKDLTLAENETREWSLRLWHEPILRCFPEVTLELGSRGRLAWVYVKRSQQWQVRSWGSLAIELAQEGGWLNAPTYDKDYRGNQPRSNVTKEKRESVRKEKFVDLVVSQAMPINEHKVWWPDEDAYVTGMTYHDEQITKEPETQFKIVMHLKVNVLSCAHPDFNWIGGIEVEIHDKKPEMTVIKKGILKRSRRLVAGPRSKL